jgi:hypothetical protein
MGEAIKILNVSFFRITYTQGNDLEQSKKRDPALSFDAILRHREFLGGLQEGKVRNTLTLWHLGFN